MRTTHGAVLVPVPSYSLARETNRYSMLARTTVLLVALLFVGTKGFLAPQTTRPAGTAFSPDKPTVLYQVPTSSSRRASTLLEAKKSKKSPGGEEKKTPSPMTLLVAYMTPWRNPNSLFVYMLLTVYALGKYSEAHPHQ